MRRTGVLTFLITLILAPTGTASGQEKNRDAGAATTLFPFISRLNGKVGFIDGTGRIVIEARFDHYPNGRDPSKSIESTLLNYRFSEHYAKVLVGDLIGYVDTAGAVKIKPQFTEAGDFSEGLAWVLKDGKYGFIDKAGEFRIKPTYDGAGNFSGGLAWVRVQDKYGFINRENKMVIEPQFEAAGDFSQKLARVKIGAKYGFINEQNERVIAPQFEDAGDFSEDLAWVSVNWKYGYINRKGERVIAPQFTDTGDFSEGLAPVHRRYRDSLYINKQGKPMIDLATGLDDALEFSHGLAAVILSYSYSEETETKPARTVGKLEYEYGYINKKGEIIFQGSMIFVTPVSTGPRHGAPGPPIYLEAERVPINVKTNPKVVKLYIIPRFKWLRDPNLVNDEQKLLRCSECLSTNTPYAGEIYSDNYMIVFELNGKKSSPIGRKINRVEIQQRSVCVDLAAQPIRELLNCAELDAPR